MIVLYIVHFELETVGPLAIESEKGNKSVSFVVCIQIKIGQKLH